MEDQSRDPEDYFKILSSDVFLLPSQGGWLIVWGLKSRTTSSTLARLSPWAKPERDFLLCLNACLTLIHEEVKLTSLLIFIEENWTEWSILVITLSISLK